jgi:hypothetical protein
LDGRFARSIFVVQQNEKDTAEVAWASLPEATTRKDCVYDILATQDLDMVGVYQASFG